jgi:uncharacterized protein with ATP-grasp and redox domains
MFTSVVTAVRVIPPPLHTSEPGSFAQDTLRRRIPTIVARTHGQLAADGELPAPVARALDAFEAELRGGVLRGLVETAPDRAAWDAAVAPHLGRSWLDLPWYFAEAFCYRRLLEATGYFGHEPLRGRDPFAAEKAAEWAPAEAPARCAALLASAPGSIDSRLHALLLGSLWGNRSDLSYNVAQQLGSYAGDAGTDLLVDDTAAVGAWLLGDRCRKVVVVADNAGTELLMDLALADHLLAACGIDGVTLHLKNHPTFVSDAIAADLEEGLRALAGGTETARALAARIHAWRAAGRLRTGTHPFYTSSLFYPQLPPDLHRELAAADLVVCKGDANYRRLCSDAHWPPETPFAEVVAGFPAPLVALRTMKAEVVVGLPAGVAAREGRRDPRWMVNGRLGMIQARL